MTDDVSGFIAERRESARRELKQRGVNESRLDTLCENIERTVHKKFDTYDMDEPTAETVALVQSEFMSMAAEHADKDPSVDLSKHLKRLEKEMANGEQAAMTNVSLVMGALSTRTYAPGEITELSNAVLAEKYERQYEESADHRRDGDDAR